MSGLAMHVGRRICSRLPMHIRPSPIADATWIRFLSSTESDETQSARSAFQQTPVNPSILKYVQRVGVGKAERKKRRNKGKSRFLTESEEKDQFGRVRKHLSTTTPPPFPSSDRRENTSLGKKVRRTPVKLLKSVGSLDSEFPKASLTMPEVVRPYSR